MKIGAQLFTTRAFCKDLTSFAETLKKVADIGYTTVQVSGTCEFEADWLKQQLEQNGLRCVITHTAPQKLQEQLAKVCADHKIFGCRCVGLGGYPLNYTTKGLILLQNQPFLYKYFAGCTFRCSLPFVGTYFTAPFRTVRVRFPCV